MPLRRLILAAISSAVSLSLIGCEGDEGPAGPPGSSTIYITGNVASEPVWEPSGPPPYPTTMSLAISDAPSIPEVRINEILCLPNSISGDKISYFTWSYLPDEPGDSMHLSVNYVDSDSIPHQAWADVMLPETPSLILPDTSYYLQIPWENDLELQWEASTGAEFYLLDFDLAWEFWDTSGAQIYDYYMLDTTIADTHLTIPLAQILPNSSIVDSTDGGWGDLDIMAQNGAWQEGDPGNIQGDGDGFFYGRTLEQVQIDLLPPVGTADYQNRGAK